jgi:hypothetical protein
MNRIGQGADSQPDIITDASATQQQAPDTSTGSNTGTPLKADLRLIKGVTGEKGVDITVEYSVNRTARLTLSVRYPDGSTKELHSNRLFEPGKSQTVIHIDTDKGKGQGSIKLMAEALNGDKDGGSINYTITSYTPNTNVLWGDYIYVNPNH